MFSKKGGERIMVSEKFGQLVRDIVGPMNWNDAAVITGISKAYLGQMKVGKVPSAKIIAKFALGFNLDEYHRKLLYKYAAEVREDATPEALLHVACEAAGLSVSARLRLLQCYREEIQLKDNESHIDPQTQVA